MNIAPVLSALSSVNDEKELFYNPWRDLKKLTNLKMYFEFIALMGNPDLVLIGEAPGYRGCRVSGIPFTSTDIIETVLQPLTSKGFYIEKNIKELTATTIWNRLLAYRVLPILWNIFPFHPYADNNPDSNRKPTDTELVDYWYLTRLMLKEFKPKHILAIGNTSYNFLTQLTLPIPAPIHKLRHPSHGGITQFNEQITHFFNLYRDQI